MQCIPRIKCFDSTLALLKNPYGYIPKASGTVGADLFETRVLLQRTICMTGPAAAQLFYEQQHLCREGAMPKRIQKTLLGEGGVQSLDGAAHKHRKQMFLALMAADRIAQLQDIFGYLLAAEVEEWMKKPRVVLYDEMKTMLTKSACEWSGVPLPVAEVALRSHQLVALYEDAGAVAWRHWKARLARSRVERWAAEVVMSVRNGDLQPRAETAIHVIAHWRDMEGALLPAEVAAVELLNILRPIVAVSVFIAQAAHALHHNPAWHQKLRQNEEKQEETLENFVQEVRRLYQFFPAVAARVQHDFSWQGYRFTKGSRVLLDLYGTNTDPRTWNNPKAFMPDRFSAWSKDPYTFIPQGGGSHQQNHRCPGEWITISLMKTFCDFLVNAIDYELPTKLTQLCTQDLPPIPQRGVVIRNVTLR
jgi:fatty-acid peroxygenase